MKADQSRLNAALSLAQHGDRTAQDVTNVLAAVPDMRHWQRCPVCYGKGIVPHGFYSSPMVAGGATSTAPEKCRSCNGRGIVR